MITLTQSAATKFKELAAQEPVGEAEVLRVAIQGGGCSGFQYALGFDRGPQDGDNEAEYHGVRVVIDPHSAAAGRRSRRRTTSRVSPRTRVAATGAAARAAATSRASLHVP